MKSIHRYEVPIDGKPHDLELTDFPLRAELVIPENTLSPYVEFWAIHLPDTTPFTVTYQVFETEHQVPDEFMYVATTQRVSGLVFHLFEKLTDDLADDDDH